MAEPANPSSEIVHRYFPDLTSIQKDRIDRLYDIYARWNAQINVISRKDFSAFYERHILHSLALVKSEILNEAKTVVDIGTGGGFPAIPLAIVFPEKEFLLVDSIAKKMKVCDEVIRELELDNASVKRSRAEELQGEFDVVATRAVAPLKTLIGYSTRGRMKAHHLLCLKGGDLDEEIEQAGRYQVNRYPLWIWFKEAFFEEKELLEIELDQGKG